ncbi:MAG: hypothetical protein R8J85_01955 [Mariprofundales bacterium]
MNRKGSSRRRMRRSQVQHKRMLKRYMMIALIMGTVGFLFMLVEEAMDHNEERSSASSAFSDDVQAPSIFSSGADGKKQQGGESGQNLNPEQVKQMKQAAEMLGIIK